METQPSGAMIAPTTPDPGPAPLLQLACAGDRAAFRKLVEGHQGRVFSIALRLTGVRADAEEVTQDVFVALHAALGQITDASHLLRWLLRAAYHRSVDRLRQPERKRRNLPLESLAGAPTGQAAESSADPLAASRLHFLLHQLQPDARAVMALRYQEDLDPADIAKVLEMPVYTVKSHLRRSLQWLRAQLEGESHGY
jgi:RNA polymerase sigma-70 factor, ECF subfamily